MYFIALLCKVGAHSSIYVVLMRYNKSEQNIVSVKIFDNNKIDRKIMKILRNTSMLLGIVCFKENAKFQVIY